MSNDSKRNCEEGIRQFLAGDLDVNRYTQDFEARNGRQGSCEVTHALIGSTLVIFCQEAPGYLGPGITYAAPAPWLAAQDEVAASADFVAWIEVGRAPYSSDLTFDLVQVNHGRPRWTRLRIPATAAA